MKRFKCKVIREDEYIIEFDEDIINDEWMEEFRKYFYHFDDLEEHAEHLAQLRARTESQFMEGYGNITIKHKGGWVEKREETGVTIIIKSEDEYQDVEVEEIK